VQLLEYREGIAPETKGLLLGPYGLGAAALSLAIPLAFAVGLGIYFRMRTKGLLKIRENAKKLGIQNVEFMQGDIEDLPLSDGEADVIISNCVLNLVANKQNAFKQMWRILKPGGRFAVSDIVLEGELPESVRSAGALYAACVSGAIEKQEYLGLLVEAGFDNLVVHKEKEYTLTRQQLSSTVSSSAIDEFFYSGARIKSITLTGRKPVA